MPQSHSRRPPRLFIERPRGAVTRQPVLPPLPIGRLTAPPPSLLMASGTPSEQAKPKPTHPKTQKRAPSPRRRTKVRNPWDPNEPDDEMTTSHRPPPPPKRHQQSRGRITICLARCLYVRVKPSWRAGRVMDAFCALTGADKKGMNIFSRGCWINPEQTIASLNLRENEELAISIFGKPERTRALLDRAAVLVGFIAAEEERGVLKGCLKGF